MSETTVKPPAPTGLSLNACSPMLLIADGDAIQEKFESWSWLMNAPSGAARLTTTVVGPFAVIDLTLKSVGLQVQGDARSRFQL